jgi:hypothetical protein
MPTRRSGLSTDFQLVRISASQLFLAIPTDRCQFRIGIPSSAIATPPPPPAYRTKETTLFFAS